MLTLPFMPKALHVACHDPALAEWLDQWLAGMQLEPPDALTIAVELSDTVQFEPDDRTPFAQPMVEIRSGPPQGDVRIRWRGGDAEAVIAEGGTARVRLTRSALADRDVLAQTFFTAVLVFLLRRAGWHHVHAAIARDPAGRGWLFAGNAQSGKSTTAALLARHGWAVGSDDLTFLTANGSGVEALSQRAPIALRPGGFALLGLDGGAAARGGRKRAFFPEELGGSWVARLRPQILALPRVEGERTRLEKVTPREALAELVRWSAWVVLEPALAQQHLDLLAALAGQAPCYRLWLGPDLFERPNLLMELIA